MYFKEARPSSFSRPTRKPPIPFFAEAALVFAAMVLFLTGLILGSGVTRDKGVQSLEAELQTSGTFYKKYQEEVLRTLRAEPRIQMVKLRMPSSVLSYRRGIATNNPGEMLWLQGRNTTIPIIAVSKNSQRFLDQMRIDYIDPSKFPSGTLARIALPFAEKDLQRFVLIPDLSGDNHREYAISVGALTH